MHGDAKPENMLCSHGPAPRCAALDFGWVGEGHAETQQHKFIELFFNVNCGICKTQTHGTKALPTSSWQVTECVMWHTCFGTK